MLTASPWSTTRTGPGTLAAAAFVPANPQMGTGEAAPGRITVPVLAHRSQAAVVPLSVHPVCGSGPCGGAGGSRLLAMAVTGAAATGVAAALVAAAGAGASAISRSA